MKQNNIQNLVNTLNTNNNGLNLKIEIKSLRHNRPVTEVHLKYNKMCLNCPNCLKKLFCCKNETKITLKPKAVILDIEGTTTDSDFISKQLFPLIRSNFKKFLDDTYESVETKYMIQRLRQLRNKIPEMPPIVVGNKEQVIKSVTDNIKWQTQHKNTSEKKFFELLCWLWMYETHLIKSHVFDDVTPALHNWKLKSIKIYTFSSGMSIAQRLLLVHTNHGNVDCLVTEYFDSKIGSKKDSKTYKTIAKKIGVENKDILFITDDTTDGMAAIDGGINAVIIKRSGNKADNKFPEIPRVSSFADFDFRSESHL